VHSVFNACAPTVGGKGIMFLGRPFHCCPPVNIDIGLLRGGISMTLATNMRRNWRKGFRGQMSKVKVILNAVTAEACIATVWLYVCMPLHT